ncbi:hypothetical protein [Parageobacillus sp. VR-IP]|uniref:hypothetical protein n=1 Tax=Parageobacillus sp. VR-IP TaxID=2742205 RepID=UPI0020C7BB43|nr:hypothetical protein [Parageobacillus sp. VR-IP]
MTFAGLSFLTIVAMQMTISCLYRSLHTSGEIVLGNYPDIQENSSLLHMRPHEARIYRLI